MSNERLNLLSDEVMEEDMEMTLSELCRACDLTGEQVFELVDHGVIEPLGRQRSCWRFRGVSVRHIRCAQRLERDLSVNMGGPPWRWICWKNWMNCTHRCGGSRVRQVNGDSQQH